MSLDGLPGCRCVKPLITIEGVCTICGKARLHIVRKVPFAHSAPPPKEAA